MASVDVQPQEERAVSQDDLRTLRRWIVVAGVWAVAATVVALIALLDDSGRHAERRADQASARVSASEERLDARIDRLDTRLRALPSSAAVARLRDQATRAERSAGAAGTSARAARSDLTDLENRVSELESGSGTTPDDGSGSGSGSGDDPGGVLRNLFP